MLTKKISICLTFFFCLLNNFQINIANSDVGQIHISNFCYIPPSPYPSEYIQPDGTTIDYYVRGNQYDHRVEMLDGKTIAYDRVDNYFKYAERGPDGKLRPGFRIAHNLESRDQSEIEFANQLPDRLDHTPAAKQDLRDRFFEKKNLGNGNNPADSGPQKAPGDGNGPSYGGVPGGTTPTTGTIKVLALFIEFPDQEHDHEISAFNNFFNQTGYNVNGANGSFRDYYLEASNGQLDVQTDVFGWYMAENVKSFYADDTPYLIREAVDAAEAAGVDFSQYDNNNDGLVDGLQVFHSLRGQEESGNPDDIWSHRWQMAAYNLGVVYDGVSINHYTVQAEEFGYSITNIGVTAHEFGHTLGLPDLYDADNNGSGGSSSGTGKWDLMAGGAWNNYGKTPAHPMAWCKQYLGWVNPVMLAGSGTISNMQAVSNTGPIYRVNTPIPTEYFLLENRQLSGFDAQIPGQGLIIWHVDETLTDNWPSANNINVTPTNLGIAGEMAYGGIEINNSETPFGLANTSFNQFSNPNSNNKNGALSTFSLINILSSGGQISFDYNQSNFCNGQMENVSLAGITANSVEVSWNNKDALSWEINYDVAGFVPGSGTNTINGLVTSTKTTIDLSSLTPDTNYELYIRGDCNVAGNGFSAWTGPISFRTYCDAPLVLPVVESFEGGSLPACWVQSLEDDLNWTFQTGNTPSPLSGPSGASDGNVYAYLETSLSFASGNYASLITPSIDLSTSLSPRITFKYHMYGEETGTLYLDVMSSSTGGQWQNIWYKTGQQQNSSVSPWSLATIDLSAYNGETPRFRFSANIVQFYSGSGPGGDISIDDIYFEESPLCLEPQEISFTEFTPTSVSVNWTPSSELADLEYGSVGFVQGAGTFVTGSTFPTTIGGLTPNTTYEIFTRNNCNADGISAWVGPYRFTTLCNITAIPYEESFETGNFSTCWIQPTTDDGNWLVRTGTTPTSSTGPSGAHNGNYYAYIETNSYTSYESAELISPTIDLTAANDPILEFYYHMYGAAIGTLRVHAENPAGSGNWELLGSVTGQQQPTSGTAFEEMVLDLAQYNDQLIRLRFTASYAYLSGATGDLAIDFIQVYERPACENPNDITASNIGINEVTLQWETGGSDTWDLQYGDLGFDPLLESASLINGITTNPYLLNGLSPETTYDVYIRDDCGLDGVSTWEGPFQFTTLCLKQTPYFENVSTNSIPVCWESDPWEIYYQGALYTSYTWKVASGATGDNFTGPAQPHDGYYFYTNETVYPAQAKINIGLISSPIDFTSTINPEFSFYHHQFSSDTDTNFKNGAGALFISVESPVGSGNWLNVTQFNGNYQSEKSDPFVRQIVDLSEYAGQVIRVKLLASYYPAQKGVIAVDDLTFGEREICQKPGELGLAGVTDTTVDVLWSDADGTSWSVRYGVPGFNPSNDEGNLITNILSPEFQLSSLLPNTDYEAYVQNNCSAVGNGTSYWSNPIAFTTLDLQTLPFEEGFDGGSGFPPNWEGSTTWPWRRESGLPLNYNGGHSSQSGPSQPYSGTHYLSFNPFSAQVNQDQFLTYSKSVDLRNTVNPFLTLWYHFFGIYKVIPTGLETNIKIQIESEWGSNQWETVQTIGGQHQFAHDDPWKELWVDLSSYSGKIIRLRLVANIGPSMNSAGTMAIDYLTISDNQCPTITTIKQVDKGLNSATIEWLGNAATAWELVIGTPGFDPNGGSIVTGISNPLFEITGLTPGTNYEVYIRSDCSGQGIGTGVWSAPFAISTTNTVTLPHSENFETGLQSDWFAPQGDNSHWRVSFGGTTTTNTGANFGGNGASAGFAHHEGGWPESNGLSYLISPVFDFTSTTTPILNFSHHFFAFNTNNLFETSGGLQIESPAFSDVWETLWSIDEITHTASQPYTAHQIDLSNYNNQLVRIRFFGAGTGIWSDFSVDDFSLMDAAICVAPSDINVSPTSSTAIIGYNKNGAPSTDVIYGTPGFNPDTEGTLLTDVSDNSFTISGLTPSSNYHLYLRNNCSVAGNGTSAWLGPFAFTTLYSISFPNLEDFDHGGAAPTGWTLTSPNRESWVVRTGTTPTSLTGPSGANSGAYYVYLEANNSATGEEAWLLSPEIDLTGASQPYLTFYSHMYGSTTGSLHAEVENPVGSGNWVSLLSVSGQRQLAHADPYEYHIFSLSEFNNPVRLRIRAIDANSVYSDIAIDDISFESIPCAIPKNITLINSNIGEATIEWNGNNESAWIVEYGEIGFTPGTGVQLNSTEESSTISGLTQGINYDVYVFADCSVQGDGSSQVIGPLLLEMMPVAPFPYVESFEDGTIQPWQQSVDDDFDWLIRTGTTPTSSTGPSGASDGSYYLYIEASNLLEGQTASIVSPIINLTESPNVTLEYYTHAYGSNIGKFELKVELPALSNNWIQVEGGGFEGQQQTAMADSYQLHSINLSDYSGTYIRVAFDGTDGASIYGDMALDQISIYSCDLIPVVSLSGITHNAANVNWIDANGEMVDLEYVPSGDPLTGNNLITGITNSDYQITGLSPATAYDVYVRSYCDITNKGRWTGPLTFETACVINIPYIEDFENAGQIPTCWEHPAALPWQWPVSSFSYTNSPTGPSQAHSGTYFLRSLSPSLSKNFNQEYYLLSPIIDLQMTTHPYLSYFFHMFGISEEHGIAIDVNFPVGSDNWDRLDEIYGSHQVKSTDNYQERFVDLSSYAGQLIRVRLTGFTGSQYPDFAAVDLLRIDERPSCPSAYSLQTVDVQPTSFTIDWQRGETTSWILEYGPEGFIIGTGTQVSTSSDESLVVNNLNPGETYQVYIQSDCNVQGNGLSAWSQPLSIQTPCVVQMDYFEGFENAVMPACWEQEVYDGGWDWKIQSGKAFEGLYSLFLDITSSNYGETYYIKSPWVDLTSAQFPILSFNYRRSRQSTSKPSDLLVDIIDQHGNRNAIFADSSFLSSSGESGFTPDKYKSLVYDLSQFIGDSIRVVIGGRNWAYSNHDISIDNFSVSESPCLPPNNLGASLITSSSAQLSWQGGYNATWDIQYGITGYENGLGSEEAIEIHGITEENYLITGLNSGTSYNFYIRSNCSSSGFGVTEWSGPFTFQTSPSFSLPFSEDFESGLPQTWTLKPGYTKWSSRTSYTPSSTGFLYAYGPTVAESGSKYIYLDAVYGKAGEQTELYSPEIDLAGATNPSLLFYYHIYSQNMGSFEVGIQNSDNPGVWSTYEINQSHQSSFIDDFKQMQIDLSDYTGEKIIIRFKTTNYRDDRNPIAIDLVSIVDEFCPPPSAILARNITLTSAQIEWHANSETTWDIEYGVSGFLPGTGILMSGISENPFTLQGLSQGTKYDIYLKANCSLGDGNWSSLSSFQTLTIETFPYTESFEEREFKIPDNWTQSGNGRIDWNVYSDVNSSFSSFWGAHHKKNFLYFGENQVIKEGDKGSIISPYIDLSDTDNPVLNFFYYRFGNEYYSHELWIDIEDQFGNWIERFWVATDGVTPGNGPYLNAKLDLSAFSGGLIRVQFNATIGRNYPTSMEALDKISFEEAPCGKPHDLTLESVNSNSAEISWTEGMQSSGNWEMTYGETEIDPNDPLSGTHVMVDSNPFTINNLQPSTEYKVYIKEVCSESERSFWAGPFIFTTTDPLSVDLGDDIISCSGETVVLDAGSGFVSYLWSTGASTQTIEVSTSDTYSVIVEDGDANTFDDAITVTINPTPTVTLGDDISVCTGESVELDAGSGFSSYQWSTGATTQTLVVNTPDTYSVTVTDANGCVGADEILVSVNETPTVTLGDDISVCTGESVELDAGSGFSSYQWSTGATTQTLVVNTPDTYSVTVTDANGCVGADEILVSVNETPTVTLGDDISICTGESVELDAGSGFSSYQWSTGATTQTLVVNTPDTYSVTVTDANGCVGADEILVSVNETPTVTLGDDISVCTGESVELDAGSGFSSYQWSTGATTQTLVVNTPDTYSVTVTDANGCVGADEILVSVNETPTVTLGDDISICTGESVELDAGSGFSSYQWSTGETSQSIKIENSEEVSVVVTDLNGCTATASVTLENYNPKVIISEIVETSVTLFWETNSTPLKLEFGESGFIQGEGNIIHNLETNTIIIADLKPSTSYDIYTTFDCQSEMITKLSFTTLLSIEGIMVIFPNPSSGMVTIKLNPNLGGSVKSLEITDALGKVMRHYKEMALELSVSNLHAGIYFAILYIDDENYTIKFIVK